MIMTTFHAIGSNDHGRLLKFIKLLMDIQLMDVQLMEMQLMDMQLMDMHTVLGKYQ